MHIVCKMEQWLERYSMHIVCFYGHMNITHRAYQFECWNEHYFKAEMKFNMETFNVVMDFA